MKLKKLVTEVDLQVYAMVDSVHHKYDCWFSFNNNNNNLNIFMQDCCSSFKKKTAINAGPVKKLKMKK